MDCLLLVDHNKRSSSISNLLHSLSIRSIIYESELQDTVTISFAIVASVGRYVTLVAGLQKSYPMCRFIFLMNHSSMKRETIEEKVNDPVFLTLPVTVEFSSEVSDVTRECDS